MAWTYEIKQQTDSEGNLLPLFTVIQWNTDKPNVQYETTITEKEKIAVYGE